MAQLGDGESFARVSVNDSIAFHLETFCSEVFEMGGVSEVHENLVVKLPHMIDGLIKRDMDDLSPAHRVVQRDSDEKCGLADSVPGDNNADISRTEAAMDRVFEQAE